MKWLFLVNDALFLAEFFGKLAGEMIKQGDDCFTVYNSKVAEYGKKKFFPDKAKFISKVDWNFRNYQETKKEFGDLSWRELFPIFDRYKTLNYSYNNSFRMVSQTYQFFEWFFEKEKPDALISEAPACLFHQVAYYFCKKNNIPYLVLGNSKFIDRIDIYNSDFTFSKYEKTFGGISSSNITKEEKEFAKNFAEKFISHQQTPFSTGFIEIYFSQFGLIKHYIKRIKESGALLFGYWRERKYFKNFDYESEDTLKNAVLAPFKMEKRQFRIFSQKNIFNCFKNDKNFFLYPLQFQPEASTAVYAAYYYDQLNTIKNIAFSLPFPYKLYVKEHLVSVGLRTGSFYKKLKKIPNVVLISPNENVENLVRNSSGVIVLTSTIGMEAALAGKPVYILGNVSYSYHPLCRKLKSFEELKNKIEEDLKSKPEIGNLEDINNRFITSYFRNTILGDIAAASRKVDANDYKEMYNNIKKIFFEK